MRASPLDNPFRGLQPYDEEDSLFGRDGDLVVMRDRIFAASTTLLFAGAGTGKTSFLKALLVPELRRRYGEHYVVKLHSDWTSRDPVAAVRECLGLSVGAALSEFIGPERRRLILILDQFEELFQAHVSTDALKRLRTELVALQSGPARPHIVLSLREEFLGSLSALDRENPDLFRNYHRLRPVNVEQARDIIEKTCAPTKADEPGLELLLRALSQVQVGGEQARVEGGDQASRLRQTEDDHGEAPITLPYLQLVCRRIWADEEESNARPDSFAFLHEFGARTTSDARALAEVKGRLRAHIEQQLGTLTSKEQMVAAGAVDYLVTSQGAKMPYELDSLSNHMIGPAKSTVAFFSRVFGLTPEVLRSALDKLTAAKVLKATDRGNGRWFELYHDMYAPGLFAWKNEYKRKQQRRAVGLFGAMAAALIAIIPISVLASKRANARHAEEASRAAKIETLEARARSRELNEQVGEALLYRLRLLDVNDGPARRRDAGLLAAQLNNVVATFRSEGTDFSAGFDRTGKYLVTRAAGPARASGERNYVIQLWNSATGRSEGQAISILGYVDQFGIDHENGRILTTSRYTNGTSLTIWRIADGKELGHRFLRDQLSCATEGAFVSCDQSMKSSTGDKVPRTVSHISLASDRATIERRGLLRAEIDPTGHRVAGVFPHGLEVLGGDDLRPKTKPIPFDRASEVVVRFSRDGSRLALLDRSARRVRVFDATTAAEVGTIELPPPDVGAQNDRRPWTELALNDRGDEVVIGRLSQNTMFEPIVDGEFRRWRFSAKTSWDPSWLMAVSDKGELYGSGESAPGLDLGDSGVSLGRSALRVNKTNPYFGGERGLVFAKGHWLWLGREIDDLDEQRPIGPGYPDVVATGVDGDVLSVLREPDRGTISLSRWPIAVTSPHGAVVRERWAASPRLAGWIERDGTVKVTDLANEKTSVVDAARGATLIALAPEGATLAAGLSERVVVVHLLQDAKMDKIIELTKGVVVEGLSFDDTGRKLLIATSGGDRDDLLTVDAASGEVTCRMEGATHAAFNDEAYVPLSVRMSPDGRFIAASTAKSVVQIYSCANKATSSRIAAEHPLAFSPDGTALLASSENETRLWSLSGQLVRELSRTDSASVAAFSPDGRWAAAITNRRQLRVWDLKSDDWMMIPFETNLRSVRFSPDGSGLVVVGDRWIHLLHCGGVDGVVVSRIGSRPLDASWSRQLEFLEASGGRVRVVTGLASGYARPSIVDFESADAGPIVGDVRELITTWQKRLALGFSEDEIIPIPIAMPSDAPSSR